MTGEGRAQEISPERAGLERYGWTPEWEKAFAPHEERGRTAGRVSVTYGPALLVRTAARELWAVIPGRMRHKARSPEAIPVVGDWVALRMEGALVKASPEDLPPDGERESAPVGRFEAEAVVEALLPRRSRLVRKAPGSPTVQQVLAANVDFSWLVSALGPDFNPRRMERYLALAREGATQPVILLNKADLVTPEEAEARAREVRLLAGPDVPVYAVSSQTGRGIDNLRAYLQPGRTVVLLGSSGVGKSSLINRLLEEEFLETREVGIAGKGRHTTTRRELVMMPEGGLMIDTPGIRELQVWEGERGVEEAFPEIEELAPQCRFTNCGHSNEPGCAVLGAIGEGTLSAERLDAWRKLRDEIREQETQREARARAEETRRGRMAQQASRRRR